MTLDTVTNIGRVTLTTGVYDITCNISSYTLAAVKLSGFGF